MTKMNKQLQNIGLLVPEEAVQDILELNEILTRMDERYGDFDFVMAVASGILLRNMTHQQTQQAITELRQEYLMEQSPQ